MHQTWLWKSTTDEQYITDGTRTLQRTREGRRPQYELLHSQPSSLEFPLLADIYEYHGSHYLVSTCKSVSNDSNTKKFDHSTIFGNISLPKSVEKKLSNLFENAVL